MLPASRALLACLLCLAGACADEPAGEPGPGGAAGGGAAVAGRPPDVLLIVVDTLRADHLSVNGYGKATTPALEDFARSAVSYTHAQSPRAKTTPAVASLLTGLYPHDHGLRDLSSRLPPDVPVLAEAFRHGGYATAAIVGNYVLREQLSGLSRGFDTWVEDLPDAGGVPPEDTPQRRAPSMTDGALVALGLAPAAAAGSAADSAAAGPAGRCLPPDRPWFLYLHYMDPHGSYDPPAAHRLFGGDAPDPIPEAGELPDDGLHARRVADYNVPPECRLPDGRADAAAVRSLYDGEIHAVDAEIGRLLGALAAAGRLDHAIVVITSDHGESLGEHRYWFEHGMYAYESTCRVPLLVRAPGVAARRSDADVSLVDLAPTLLELAGLPPLPPPPARGAGSEAAAALAALAPRGRSFAPWLLAGRGGPPDHPVFCEKTEGESLAKTVQIKGVRLGDWKYLRRYAYHTAADAPGPRELTVLSEELYDLRRDPAETTNLMDAPPADAPLARLQAELVRFAAADVHFSDLAERLAAERERLERDEPDVFRTLQQLGYFR